MAVVEWIYLALDTDKCRVVFSNFSDQLSYCYILKMGSGPCSLLIR
jgi:hypothetical protein